MTALLSDGYNDERRRLIGRDASLGWSRTVPGFAPVVDRTVLAAPACSPARRAGEPTVARLGVIGADTCHIDVIDKHGNMVSATPSGGWLQSSRCPGLGFPWAREARCSG